jgi:hypothetical protein
MLATRKKSGSMIAYVQWHGRLTRNEGGAKS